MVNYRQNAVIARAVGAVTIALGFVGGMYGLQHPGSVWLSTALGLLATGMIAQGYALYCSIRRATQSRSDGDPPTDHTTAGDSPQRNTPPDEH
jgi:hypothetical protein